MEAGVNIRFIQTILGHKSIKTTEIYTHVSVQNMNEVYAPIDDVI